VAPRTCLCCGMRVSFALFADAANLSQEGKLNILGVFDALQVATLPAVHPRMGTPSSAADSAPLLESPGFMLLNYGRPTPVLTLLAHMAYGAIVGAFVAGAAH